MASAVPSSPAPTGPPPGAVPARAASSPVPPSPPLPLTGSLHQAGANRVPSIRVLEWTSRGSTKVVGNVEVITGELTGSSTVGGSVTARTLSLSGIHRVDGEIHVAQELRTRGTFRAGSAVLAGRAHLAGTVEIGGALTVSENLEWNGTLEVGSDAHAGSVLFQGQLGIRGTLSARSITGRVEGLSKVGEIHADWIEIRRRKDRLPMSIFLLPPPAWHDLEVQRIEANEVHLEGVRVRHLKADRIWLGPHSHVEYLEGTLVERHKDAHVGPESESPPPPGLSR
jgi:cytoskeletal protein CcmA (bactofilin family)